MPYADETFDAIISISIFTHLNEESQKKFLEELWRVSAPKGHLFLTVCGQRVLDRALNETQIRAMLWVEEGPFQNALRRFADGEHGFILQHGHLTTANTDKSSRNPVITEPFEYGITFIPEEYVRNQWSRWFDIVDYRHGAIHDFQDIVVLVPKK